MSGFGKYVIIKVAEEMGYSVLVVGDMVMVEAQEMLGV
jgi:hypothetical protein